MPKVSPLLLLLALLAMGAAVAVMLPQMKSQPVVADPASPAEPPAQGEDLRKQLKLMEGQVEYLQGQVGALQEENTQLIQKLGSLGMKGTPKMEPPTPDDDPPDFVGMGLDMMKLRKLQALPIPTTGVSMAEVEAAILLWLRQQQPDDEGPRFGLALTALGWIDKPVDPLPLRAAWLARQLGGWYDFETETLLTVDGGASADGKPAPDKPLAIAFGQLLREYGSTLFPADPEHKTRLSTDQRLAREALLSGDAGLTRFLFGLQNPAAQPKSDLPAEDPDHPLNEVPMPAFLRELSMFPFSRGFEFVQSLHSAGEFKQINAAYSRPPTQSAEVIEAERYLDNNPLPSPSLDWAKGKVAGAEPFWDDTLGKFVCFTALRTYNNDEDAGQGAKGWLADRLLVYPTDKGTRDHAAWQTLWLTPKDAKAFFKAMRNCLLQRYDVKAGTDTADVVSLEANGRHVHLIKNRAGAGVLLIDAASAEFASALRTASDGVSKTAQ
jgi:hypothetical protein